MHGALSVKISFAFLIRPLTCRHSLAMSCDARTIFPSSVLSTAGDLLIVLMPRMNPAHRKSTGKTIETWLNQVFVP